MFGSSLGSTSEAWLSTPSKCSLHRCISRSAVPEHAYLICHQLTLTLQPPTQLPSNLEQSVQINPLSNFKFPDEVLGLRDYGIKSKLKIK